MRTFVRCVMLVPCQGSRDSPPTELLLLQSHESNRRVLFGSGKSELTGSNFASPEKAKWIFFNGGAWPFHSRRARFSMGGSPPSGLLVLFVGRGVVSGTFIVRRFLSRPRHVSYALLSLTFAADGNDTVLVAGVGRDNRFGLHKYIQKQRSMGIN